jgi:hypothetical protein
VARIGVPLLVGALELVHPSWTDSSVAEGVAAAGAAWIPLHLLLIAGYGLLVLMLWSPVRLPRVLLMLFLVANTAFLATDGLALGLLAQTDPAAADALWNAPAVTVLADVTGACWAAALLALAWERSRRMRGTTLLLALVWLLVVGSAALPDRTLLTVLVVAIGAYRVYVDGASALPFALFVIAATFRQHVGPEAALGMLCIAAAQTIALLRERSAPAASSPPVPG